MTSKWRRCDVVTSHRRHYDVMCLLGIWPPLAPPPQYSKPWPPNILNLPTPMILFCPITLEAHRGTTDEFTTIPFLLVLISAALVELAKSIPVHSLILSSHHFFCLPYLFFWFPFTVPCRIVFAKPEDIETWPNHISFHFLTRVRSSSYSQMAAWIFLQTSATSSLVTGYLYEMFNSLR